MKSKKLKWFLIALIIVLLSPVIFLEGLSIYSYLRYKTMPSASAQLLDFVEIPRDTVLLRKGTQVTDAYSTNAYNTDYRPVDDILIKRFPVGASRQEIEQFSKKHDCTLGSDKIICSFEGVWYRAHVFLILFPARIFGWLF